MSSYCNKKSKTMIIGECQMIVVELKKLIYRLKVSTLISSNKRPYIYIGILEQTLFWVLASIGPNFQNFYFLTNTASLIPKKKCVPLFFRINGKICNPFKIENC